MNLHPVSLEHLKKLAASERRIHPNDIPFAVDNDLREKGLITYRGTGKNMTVELTAAGQGLLREIELKKDSDA